MTAHAAERSCDERAAFLVPGRLRPHTRSVRGRAGLGAAIGLWVGLALIGLLILLPRAREGSFYEVGDPLIVMGVPLLVMGTAVGAMVGVALARSPRQSSSQPTQRSTATLFTVVIFGCLVAVWVILWGTGLLNTPH